jgi:hypothetical protein
VISARYSAPKLSVSWLLSAARKAPAPSPMMPMKWMPSRGWACPSWRPRASAVSPAISCELSSWRAIFTLIPCFSISEPSVVTGPPLL